jgi:hypothetical protein
MSEFCIDCGIEMSKSYAKFNEMRVEALKCGKCGKRVFPEHLAMKALAKLEQKNLEPFYFRNVLKIGSSWAITLPKDVADSMGITKKTKFKIRPNLKKNLIEIHKHK